jgi:eukaryotic-like serine/threonine-protein kinase
VAAAVLLHEPPFPARAGRRLGGLLMAMLAKNPDARPTAAQVRASLTGAPPPAAPVRRRWRLPVVLAAIVLLGAGGWYAVTALNGVKEVGSFAAAPDPCALLTDAQAAELMKGEVERSHPRPNECQWLVRATIGERKLTVRVWTEPPNEDRGGPEVALMRYTSERGTRAAAKGTQNRQSFGDVKDVRQVGESAFVQNSFRFHLGSTDTGIAESVLLFRDSNLLGEVLWQRKDVPDEKPADPETATAGARLVSAAVTK